MADKKERKGPNPKSLVHDLFTVILGGGAVRFIGYPETAHRYRPPVPLSIL